MAFSENIFFCFKFCESEIKYVCYKIENVLENIIYYI